MSTPKTSSNRYKAVGLPLDKAIDYNATGPIEPTGEWPPRAIRGRMRRLAWFCDLFQGDFSQLHNYIAYDNQTGTDVNRFTVQSNIFRLVATTFADILMMSPPEYENPRLGVNIMDSLYQILTHQYVYGAAVVLVGEDPLNPLEVLEPSLWVPTDEGWWYLDPIANEEGDYFSVNITQYSEFTGQITNQAYNFHGFTNGHSGTIGDPVGEPSVTRLEQDPLRVIKRKPLQFGGAWGTSVIEDLVSPVAQINRRYTDIDIFLNSQTRPTIITRTADPDRTQIPQDGTVDPESPVPAAEALDPLDAAWKVGNVYEQWAVPDRVQSYETVTWDGRVDEALMFIEHLQNVIEAHAAIPGLFSGLTEGGVASGVALNRLLLRLYAASLHMQTSTEVAVNELLQLVNVPELDWPNALVAMNQVTETPEEGIIE